MKANTTNENPVYACMALFGRKPLHPMMGLARLDETKISTEQISLGCYLTVFTQNTNTCNHTCYYNTTTPTLIPATTPRLLLPFYLPTAAFPLHPASVCTAQDIWQPFILS